METAFWSFAISFWKILFGGALFGALIWLSVLTLRRQRGSRQMLLLEILRLIIAGLLVFTLFRPEYVRLTKKYKEPLVAVLFDGSESMDTRDVVVEGIANPITRAEWVDQQRTNQFWSPLEETYKVVVEDFSSKPKPIEAKPASDAENEPTPEVVETDHGTDLDLALASVLERHKDLRAVFLLSDGDWNQGKSPVASATRMRLDNIPVYSLVVGSDAFLPDIELRNVSAPAYGLMDEHISIPFTIQSRLPKEVRTTVTLVGPRGVEASQSVIIPPMAQLQDTISLKPQFEGSFEYTLKLPVDSDETFQDNNQQAFTMGVRRELLKVLVVETTPRWEFRFLHNALSRDPGVEVQCVLKHPGMPMGGGRNYIPAFPQTRDELSKYDVVFLGDVGIGADGISSENAELLKGLVEQQGSGLVFLPGMAGNQLGLIDSVLGDMYPVVLDPAQKSGFGFEMESKLNLTSRGRDHLLTMLATDPRKNTEVWKSLPGFFWHAQVVKAKLGTDVLATHATSRNEHGRLPLLVTKPAGNGKVLFMGTDNAWRWRRGVEDTYHYRFWGQVVRWMAHQRHLAHQEGIRFFYNPEMPRRNEKVFLHATVFNASGFPIEEGTVKATITESSGRVQELTMTPEPGGWGVFTAEFVPKSGGDCVVDVVCKEAERVLHTTFNVQSPKRERVGLPSRASVLREVSSLTQGAHGSVDDLAALVGQISLMEEAKPLERRLRLWCHPLWAALLIGLLAIYWVGRKLTGQI